MIMPKYRDDTVYVQIDELIIPIRDEDHLEAVRERMPSAIVIDRSGHWATVGSISARNYKPSDRAIETEET